MLWESRELHLKGLGESSGSTFRDYARKYGGNSACDDVDCVVMRRFNRVEDLFFGVVATPASIVGSQDELLNV